ncbi:MAG: hypothetical protein ABGX00_07110 [Allomuricauda sp.]
MHQIKFPTFLIINALVLLVCCTDSGERDVKSFEAKVHNNSGVELIILGFNEGNSLVFQQNISNLNSSSTCKSISEVFNGYRCNNTDSIVIKFPNNKGYICDLRGNGNTMCFSNNRNPLTGECFQKDQNNLFEFKTTVDDFENAYVLPK